MVRRGSGTKVDRMKSPTERRMLGIEIWLLLGVSLGASAIWSVLSITSSLTDPTPLQDQQSGLNESVTPDRPWLDLAYQLAGVTVDIVPALLALYLLSRTATPVFARIGLDFSRPRVDLGGGVLLAAAIGIPGLGLYLLARSVGFNTDVIPAALGEHWWTVPVLILSAFKNAFAEEIIVVGYLLLRLDRLGWSPVVAIAASSLLRGTYHLYQGFGGFIGNVIMGVIFALIFRWTGRVGPLVVAHLFIDIVAFVGYPLLYDQVSWL